MEEKEVLSGALAKAELGRVTARAALADLVAAANPAELTMRVARNFIKQLYPGADKDSDAGILMADMKEEGEALFAAIERARKVMKEEA